MKNILKLMIITVILMGCRDSRLSKCIEMKMDKGMSLSDAREECKEGKTESQIRK